MVRSLRSRRVWRNEIREEVVVLSKTCSHCPRYSLSVPSVTLRGVWDYRSIIRGWPGESDAEFRQGPWSSSTAQLSHRRWRVTMR